VRALKITLETFIQICTYFTVVCVAVGWMIKIVKGAKKPADDVNKMLDNDNKRLKRLEESEIYISRSISLLMKSNLVILGHLSTNNNTGEMTKMQEEMREFLINN
jgi:uncharacterized membrane protein (DUF106 family)